MDSVSSSLRGGTLHAPGTPSSSHGPGGQAPPYGPERAARAHGMATEVADGPGAVIEHDFYGRGLQSSMNDIMVGEEGEFEEHRGANAGLLLGSESRDAGNMGSGLEGGTIEREIDVQNVDERSEVRRRARAHGSDI